MPGQVEDSIWEAELWEQSVAQGWNQGLSRSSMQVSKERKA